MNLDYIKNELQKVLDNMNTMNSNNWEFITSSNIDYIKDLLECIENNK